jgi:two-component system OmpR family sensor kinase
LSVSLRARLTLGLVALAAIGLIVAGLATFGALRLFLVDRVDAQLDSVLARPAAGARAVVLPAGGYYEVRTPNGTVVRRDNTFLIDSAPPDLPATLPGGAFTVDATTGSTNFRVASSQLANGNTFVVALPLDDVRQTLRRLVFVEFVVAAAVLSALAALGWWLVGLGLRPLERMGRTADAIARGDLSQRVEPATSATEVGRLGLALNGMLHQIEGAFAERAASEARLRQFAADASHELRTPLTSIRGYAELFRRGADQRPEDLAKAMRRIEEEAVRMGVLVDDLLLLARLDQGRPLEQHAVDLTKLARDAVDDAQAVDAHRNVTLATNGAVTVLGDEQRLRQVLANLLTNAFTHTPEGTPVRVSVHTAPHEALIEVADQGPGLSEQEQAQVFEQFWRADTARQRATGGAGLGLSIVRAIAVAHGGTVEVTSTPGQGATFRVHLPSA